MIVRPPFVSSVTFSLRTLSAAVLLFVSLSQWLNTPSVGAQTPFPVGVLDVHEPSGLAPPPANAVPGYHLTYLNDFGHQGLPHGWYAFTGTAGGIPTDRFSAHHVIVTQGLLRLKTYRDPSNSNHWTTAGLCQCLHHFTYGAVFVRSRVTGPGVNAVELLWPSSNTWPPEIDFNEDLFKTDLTTATVHWQGNHTNFHILRINMLRWHTWGVIWTPTHVIFTVDGRPWHEFAASALIPHIPMNLDFEQTVKCPSPKTCPLAPSSMLIDWVAEYQPN